MDAHEATRKALQPSAEAGERARQDMGLLPFAHTVPDGDKKRPIDWAVHKGMAKLNRDKSLHYTTHTPWQYQCAYVVHRWPNPELDPTFVITEEEFLEAVEAAIAGRSLEHHREEKREERSKLEELSDQIDANNKSLAAAVRDSAVPKT